MAEVYVSVTVSSRVRLPGVAWDIMHPRTEYHGTMLRESRYVGVAGANENEQHMREGRVR